MAVLRNFIGSALSVALSLLLAFGAAAWSATVAFAEESDRLPASYYLTNLGEATPSKLQSPWGDCWAFAVASAIESSILKAQHNLDQLQDEADGFIETKTGADAAAVVEHSAAAIDRPQLVELDSSVDVSERAIAWFAHQAQSKESGGSQAGEGFYLVNPEDVLQQLSEGSLDMVESQLVSRQNLISEEAAPYVYNDYDANPVWFSAGTSGAGDARLRDWSLPDEVRVSEDIGWRVTEIYDLPDPAELKTNYATGISEYTGYNPSATYDIKLALMNVGAVAIALEAESSIPQEVTSGRFEASQPSAHFTYSTWSQFNGALEIAYNHSVTIVGWDDGYAASNFAGTASGSPPGNGAWLCKNNWGSDELYASMGALGDATRWGLPASSGVNSQGTSEGLGNEATGFFWLSYYDHSIKHPVAFGVSPVDESLDIIHQYDFLGPGEYSTPSIYNGKVEIANVFTADTEELIRAVTGWTFDKADTINVSLYTFPAEVDPTLVDANEFFERANLVCEQSETFENAGFHTIMLDKPVVLAPGERLIVAEHVQTYNRTVDGEKIDASYLSLELAYTQNIAGNPQVTMANVVSNLGESYVNLGDGWMTIQDYTTTYAVKKADGGLDVDMIFGNALIKALGSETTLSKAGQTVKMVKL